MTRYVPDIRTPSTHMDSRVYVHGECGGQTWISGDDFERLANPFAWVRETRCCHCGRGVPLWKVRWTDTDEPLDNYRRRLWAAFPWSRRWLFWMIGPLCGALLGMPGTIVVFTLILGEMPLSWSAGTGAVAGAVASATHLTPWLMRRFFKMDFRGVR